MKSILIALKINYDKLFLKRNFNFPPLHAPSVEFLGGFTMLKELKLPNQIEKRKKTHSANQIPCNCF
jgi:hypothetical protein